ncbi:MAG: hypothetical protein NTU81_02935 [Candidatus Nomurabacteria bacterium]|nr:hypothetical protein [Candidatus Nomurabacteria bacterium]
MKNFEVIFEFIFYWFAIGWIFTFIKMKYWHNVLIKKNIVSLFSDLSDPNLGFKIYFPISLIWPMQTFSWLLSDYDKENKYRKPTMPITPLGYQGLEEYGRISRSNINYAIIHNESTYVGSYDFVNIKISKTKYIRNEFILGTLFGGFHIMFWLYGVCCLMVALAGIISFASFFEKTKTETTKNDVPI